MLDYSKAVSNVSQREAYKAGFRTTVAGSCDELDQLVDESDEKLNTETQRIVDMVRKLNPHGNTNVEASHQIISTAQSVLKHCTDLVNLYKDIEKEAMTVPDIQTDGFDREKEREAEAVARMLGIGMQEVELHIRKMLDICEDPKNQTITNADEEEAARTFAIFQPQERPTDFCSSLRHVEKGVRMMLRSMPREGGT